MGAAQLSGAISEFSTAGHAYRPQALLLLFFLYYFEFKDETCRPRTSMLWLFGGIGKQYCFYLDMCYSCFCMFRSTDGINNRHGGISDQGAFGTHGTTHIPIFLTPSKFLKLDWLYSAHFSRMFSAGWDFFGGGLGVMPAAQHDLHSCSRLDKISSFYACYTCADVVPI